MYMHSRNYFGMCFNTNSTSKCVREPPFPLPYAITPLFNLQSYFFIVFPILVCLFVDLASGGKAPGKQAGHSTSSSSSDNSSSNSNAANAGGGNIMKIWPTPEWQKGAFGVE